MTEVWEWDFPYFYLLDWILKNNCSENREGELC